MIIGLKFATLVMAVTPLIVSGILGTTIPATAQGQSSSSGSDPISFLQSAEIHLVEATKEIKMGNSQATLTQINMATQAITLAGLKLNATIICHNIRNEGYCVAP